MEDDEPWEIPPLTELYGTGEAEEAWWRVDVVKGEDPA